MRLWSRIMLDIKNSSYDKFAIINIPNINI